MRKFFLILYASLLIPSPRAEAQARFRVMAWNVENLFDTRHDTLKNDHEFLPQAYRHWTYTRYRQKLDNVARVIAALGEWEAPALVALCEVENDTVLIDLTRHSPLKEWRYRFVSTHSPDPRGIDVALLYQRDRFKLLSSRSIRIAPLGRHHRTRDLLHASGLLLTGDTLDIIVCHLPSRTGGVKESAPYRDFVASRIRAEADSLLHARYHPQLIILGDFNDYPSSSSIRKVLQAVAPPTQPAALSLYHLPNPRATQNVRGSYKYRGRWELIDHILVSGTLLDTTSSFFTSDELSGIFAPPFLLVADPEHDGLQPFRTYKGMKYQGGYSDHLPVYADFIDNNNSEL
ncbi:MAG: endonuclease [Mediterranea sp.]|jgi:predicted extracellular nuclease|nr:endonuclease [Mediterranea sp.]